MVLKLIYGLLLLHLYNKARHKYLSSLTARLTGVSSQISVDFSSYITLSSVSSLLDTVLSVILSLATILSSEPSLISKGTANKLRNIFCLLLTVLSVLLSLSTVLTSVSSPLSVLFGTTNKHLSVSCLLVNVLSVFLSPATVLQSISSPLSVLSILTVISLPPAFALSDPTLRPGLKMSDLAPETKQRVVVEFLTGEGVAPDEIHRRLSSVYGHDAAAPEDVARWATKPGESELRLEGRLMQRAVIQFLTAEGERPLEISWRLSAVYRTVPYSRCSIWRWATRYHQGDRNLGDKTRHGRIPDRMRRSNTTTVSAG